jgi:hypothetical protein
MHEREPSMLRAIGFGLRLRTQCAGGAILGCLLALLALAAPNPACAEHEEPSASSVPELVVDLGARLDELAGAFGSVHSLPDFDERRFNKLLRRARTSLDLARRHVEHGQACEGIFKLARSVSQLEHAADYGAAQNMSGWSFADDLAGQASFIAESFLEELIVLAGQEGADPSSLDLAVESEEIGEALRQDEEWTAATVEFVAGTCALL